MTQEQVALSDARRAAADVRALTPPTPRAERLSVLLVLATVAVALLLGWALKAAVQGRTSLFSDGVVTLAYPAAWVASQDEEGQALLRNPRALSSLFAEQVRVTHRPRPTGGPPGASPLAEATTAWTLSLAQELNSFRNLATEEGLTVDGQPAMQVTYAYVADPAAALGRPGIPVVVRGSDTILVVGDTMTVLTGQAAQENWAAFEPVLAKVIASVRLASAAGQ